MKENPKAFFSFARARQTTRAKVGPFMDPSSSQPNASPDYCCTALKDQYDSVFAQPRQEWQVKDLPEHFRVNTPDHENLTDVSFSREDIEAALCTTVCCWPRWSTSCPAKDVQKVS